MADRQPTQTWQTQQTTPEHEVASRAFFWRLLLTASSIAALVSLLTTAIGLDRYVSRPLAWSLAAAVQLGLFGLAWLIGSGREVRRWWICSLYLVTMLFSVTFSYVTLQSEFTAQIRPAEAQRRLFDLSRQQLTTAQQQVNAGLQQSRDLEIRLAAWIDLEQKNGWTTRTCAAEDHCYLNGVCDRIGRRIDRWQETSGRTYREGPGEKLIFGALQTELQTLRQVRQRLGTYHAELTSGDILAQGVDNRERLRRLDGVLNQMPLTDLESLTCQAMLPIEPPSYADHARDAAVDEEQPVYAFADLVATLRSEAAWGSEDYPTLFAFALALFIDLFVLVVALGAATLLTASPRRRLPGLDVLSPAVDEALRRDIDGWIDGAMLDPRAQVADRQSFLSSVVSNISFSAEGAAQLVPEDAGQRRFGHLLVASHAATQAGFVKYNRVGRLFVLADWVYPALCRHLVSPPSEAPQVSNLEAADRRRAGSAVGEPAPVL